VHGSISISHPCLSLRRGTCAVLSSWMAPGVAPLPKVAGRMRPVFRISTTSITEQQCCLHRNCLYIRSVKSAQLFEVDSRLEEEDEENVMLQLLFDNLRVVCQVRLLFRWSCG